FSPRIAGNFANDDIIGSLEYGSGAVGARVIVVLGHSDCGAVKGACDNVKLGDLLPATLASIKPAIDAVPNDGSPRNSKNYAFVQRAADMNVTLAVSGSATRVRCCAEWPTRATSRSSARCSMSRRAR